MCFCCRCSRHPARCAYRLSLLRACNTCNTKCTTTRRPDVCHLSHTDSVHARVCRARNNVNDNVLGVQCAAHALIVSDHIWATCISCAQHRAPRVMRVFGDGGGGCLTRIRGRIDPVVHDTHTPVWLVVQMQFTTATDLVGRYVWRYILQLPAYPSTTTRQFIALFIFVYATCRSIPHVHTYNERTSDITRVTASPPNERR